MKSIRNIFGSKPALLVCVIALAAVVMFTGCPTEPNSGGGGGNTDPKTLTITGINTSEITKNGIVVLLKPDTTAANNYVAGGYIAKGETVTIQLKNYEGSGYGGSDWTGTGNYYLILWKSSDGSFSGTPDYTAEKKSFSSATTTVAWSEFQAYTP